MVLHVRAIHPDLMLHLDNAMAHSLTLGEGTPVPAKLVVLHLAGATDAGYFINFVSGAPAPHGTPDQKLRGAEQPLAEPAGGFGCGQCSGGGSSSASGLRDAPAVRSREKAGRPPGSPRHQEAGWKGQRTGAVPAKGPTDNPALEPRERLEQATAPEGLGQPGPGDGLAAEPGAKGAPATGRGPARACSPPRENVFETSCLPSSL